MPPEFLPYVSVNCQSRAILNELTKAGSNIIPYEMIIASYTELSRVISM